MKAYFSLNCLQIPSGILKESLFVAHILAAFTIVSVSGSMHCINQLRLEKTERERLRKPSMLVSMLVSMLFRRMGALKKAFEGANEKEPYDCN